MVSDEPRVMRGFEHLHAALGHVDRRYHDAVARLSQRRFGPKNFLDHLPQLGPVVFWLQQRSPYVGPPHAWTSAFGEYLRTALHKEVANPGDGYLTRDGESEQSSDGGARDEVEAPAERPAGTFLQPRQNLCAVKP
jgi:hypothetical protein